jgi:hypothetical protein
LYGASWISDCATIGWLSFRSALALAIIAVTSAALTIVRDAAADACGDAGCWALAAIESTDKRHRSSLLAWSFPLSVLLGNEPLQGPQPPHEAVARHT